MTAALDTDTAAEETEVPWQELTPSSLQPHPRNRPSGLGDLDDLTESIKACGVLQPLVVVPAKAKGKYRIITGHRRHAAAKAAGLKRVPCIVRTDLDNESDQLAAMLAENGPREPLPVLDEAAVVQGLLDLGDSVKAASTRTGLSQKRIRDRAKIASAPESVKKAIGQHTISLDDAVFIASHCEVPADRDQLEQALGTNNWTWAKERVTARIRLRKADAAMRKAAEAAGIRVYSSWSAMQEDVTKGVFGDPELIKSVEVSASQEPPSAKVVAAFDPPGDHAIIERNTYFEVHRFKPVPAPVSDNTDYDDDDDAETGAPASTSEDSGPAPTAAPVSARGELTEEQKAALDARLERRADLAAAEKVRHAFLTERVAAATKDDAVLVLKAAAANLIDTRFMDASQFSLLGLPFPAGPGLSAGRDQILLEWVTEQTSVERLAWAVAVLMFVDESETTFTEGLQDELTADELPAAPFDLATLLPALGYVWSDIERAQLFPPTDDDTADHSE
ncbi:ParB/RepB/Spo0J family partition protein [Williamsia sp.]|uniref:ParB/RepB/Spo0J family partition protein n=1 Tax=Williamsia sp. TaxID=1872085 RepID=UPI002F920AF5